MEHNVCRNILWLNGQLKCHDTTELFISVIDLLLQDSDFVFHSLLLPGKVSFVDAFNRILFVRWLFFGHKYFGKSAPAETSKSEIDHICVQQLRKCTEPLTDRRYWITKQRKAERWDRQIAQYSCVLQMSHFCWDARYNKASYLRAQDFVEDVFLCDLLVEFLFPEQRHSRTRTTSTEVHLAALGQATRTVRQQEQHSTLDAIKINTPRIFVYLPTLVINHRLQKSSHIFLHGCVVKNAWY